MATVQVQSSNAECPKESQRQKNKGQKEITRGKSKAQMPNAGKSLNDRKIRGRKMSWLKSQVQMTNDEISPNDECPNGSSTDACRSGRGLEFVIRHSSFGFWPSPVPNSVVPTRQACRIMPALRPDTA